MQTDKSCKIRDRDCKQTIHQSDKQFLPLHIKGPFIKSNQSFKINYTYSSSLKRYCILVNKNDVRVKKEGSYDGNKVCELVGLDILDILSCYIFSQKNLATIRLAYIEMMDQVVFKVSLVTNLKMYRKSYVESLHKVD